MPLIFGARRGWSTLLLGGLLAASLLIVLLAWRPWGETQSRIRVAQFALAMPGGAAFATDTAEFAISPDGHEVAVDLRSDGVARVWLQDVDAAGSIRPLPGTDGVSSTPAWSPDGRHLAFVSGGTLKRVALDGGAVVPICDLDADADVDWGPDETILIGAGGARPIRRIGAAGGTLQPITRLNPGEQHTFPRFVPGARSFLFGVQADPLRDGLWIGSLDGGRATRLVAQAASALVAGGFLLYSQGQTIVAQRFDAATLALSGEPSTVIGNVRTARPSRRPAFSASEANAVLVFQGTEDQSLQVITGWPSLIDAR